jgi:hypothetical protein
MEGIRHMMMKKKEDEREKRVRLGTTSQKVVMSKEVQHNPECVLDGFSFALPVSLWHCIFPTAFCGGRIFACLGACPLRWGLRSSQSQSLTELRHTVCK